MLHLGQERRLATLPRSTGSPALQTVYCRAFWAKRCPDGCPDRTKEYGMLRNAMRTLTAPLRLLWRVTGKPIYRRLFQIYFDAVINRLNSALGELSTLRAEVERVRAEVVECRAQNEELDRHVRTVVASHWDTTALTRRL